MLKRSLLEKLQLYNLHLGHLIDFNSQLSYYILGRRFNYYIIDLDKSFILLKKALYFITHLSKNNGSLLYHYSVYSNLSVLYKCVLLSISKQYNQQLITYNWIFGSISSYFFSFIYIINAITCTWMQRTASLLNLNASENHDLDGTSYHLLDYVHRYVTNKSHSLSIPYNSWYHRWLKYQKSYKLYQAKKSSFKQTNFIRQMCLNDIKSIWKKKKMMNFKYYFLKMFYYISYKKKDPFILDKENFFTFDKIHSFFISYWRFLLYFKYFNNYFQIPDALFSVFPDNNDLPSNEYSSASLVSIGLVDTNSNISNIQYPIVSNDDSFLIVCFFFSLFSNVFMENQYNLYTTLKNSMNNK